MTVTLGTVLAAWLMIAEQGGSTTASGNTVRPKYHRYDFESACGSFVFQVRFRNVSRGGSRVDRVLIDGRPVPSAAKTVDRFAARRKIDQIEIMNCGMDPLRPVFRGIVVLSKPESQPAIRESTLFFRLIRDGKGWRISVG